MAGKSLFDVIGFGPAGYGDELVGGLVMTISIAICAYLLGLAIGFVGAVLKLNGSSLSRRIMGGYTTLVRAVPELVLILLLFYAGTASLNALLAQFQFGNFAINGFLAAVCVLGFVQGAYSTEVLRAAMLAIPVGQLEAARAYGMSTGLEFRRIVLPAMLPYALPGLANLWLIVTKDTALIAVVGYTELALATRQAAGNTKMYFTFYVLAGALYLAISLLSQKGFNLVEARVRKGQRLQTDKQDSTSDSLLMIALEKLSIVLFAALALWIGLKYLGSLNYANAPSVGSILSVGLYFVLSVGLVGSLIWLAVTYAWARLAIKTVVLAVLAGFVALVLYWLVAHSRWDWLPKYATLFLWGGYYTLTLLALSIFFGFILAVPVGLVQVTGPTWLASLAKTYCTVIRGTPLLVQLWLIYYGLGSLFPQIGLMFPGFRENFSWLIRLDAYWYALLAFILSFAGYEGELMRGAFLGVPRGELEAARAYGMTPFQTVRRVWLPRAVRLVLPTLLGEIVLQLKSTPLAFTVTVMDLMGVTSKVRQDTYLTFEPLVFLGILYICITIVITKVFQNLEAGVPQRR